MMLPKIEVFSASFKERITELLKSEKLALDVLGVEGSERAYINSMIQNSLDRPVIIVTSDNKQAKSFIEDFKFFLKEKDNYVSFFPSHNILPFKNLSYHSETTANRVKLLYKMVMGENPPILVTTIDAVLQKLMPQSELSNFAEIVMVNESLDSDDFVSKLIAGGYVKTILVEEPGDFSVRGGIIDVYSPQYEEPIRIELFGDM